MELTGHGDYIQPLIQSIKLRNTPPALRSNDLLDAAATGSEWSLFARLE
jgi:hypothetical protein